MPRQYVAVSATYCLGMVGMRVPLTPLEFLERARRVFGPLEAVADGERRFTYAELADRCHRLAALLRAQWCAPGDRVAYLCGNTVELLEAYYGVLLAGAVLVPLNVRLAPAELQFVLDDCEARLLMVHPTFEEAAAGLQGRRRRGRRYRAPTSTTSPPSTRTRCASCSTPVAARAGPRA